MTPDIFSKGMAMLRVSFPQSKFQADDLTMDVWFESLRDLTDNDFIVAVKDAVQNNKFFPSIAELREKAVGLSTQDIEGKALQAWQKVKLGVRRAGYMQSVKFDDPIIHSVVYMMGGWKKFCSMEEDDERFFRPQFLKSYISFSRLHAGGKLPLIPYLAGEAEIQNIARGNDSINEKPIEITDDTVRKSLEYTPPSLISLPEQPEDLLPLEEVQELVGALISKITQREL